MRLAASISDDGSLSRAPDSFSRIQASSASRRTSFLRPSRTVGRAEACRTLPSVALETCALEQRSSRATSFKVSNFLCGSIRYLRRRRPKNGGASMSEPHGEGAPIARPLSRCRESKASPTGRRGLVAASGWGVGAHDQARSHRFRRKQTGSRNGQSGTPVCSGCSAFSRLFPSLQAGVRAAKRRRRKGSTQLQQVLPFQPLRAKIDRMTKPLRVSQMESAASP